MFRIFPSGNAADISQIKGLAVKYDRTHDGKSYAYVNLYGIDDFEFEAARFETEDDAKNYIARLVAEFNNFTDIDLANKSCVFKKSETIINSERNAVTSTEGAEFKLNSIKALFVFDDKAFAVVDSEPVLLFNPTSDFSAVNEEESEHFIEKLAPYCDQLRRIRDTDIFFNKLDAGCTCIDPKCSVYVVVDGVLIFVKTFQTFTRAKNYCKFLQKEYDF